MGPYKCSHLAPDGEAVHMYLELRTLDPFYVPATRVLHMDPAILLESRAKSGVKLMLHRASPVPAPLQDQPRYRTSHVIRISPDASFHDSSRCSVAHTCTIEQVDIPVDGPSHTVYLRMAGQHACRAGIV